MSFQRNLAMFSTFKFQTLLLCLVLMHTTEADDDVHELREKQKLVLQQRENDLLQMQRELQIQLQRVHSEKLKLEQPDSEVEDAIDSEYEYPSYCANCLGDTLEHVNKNLLSSELSRKVDSSTRKSIQTEKEIRQLSDHNRLEAIKQQILLKLNLSEKPNVTSSIPKQFILDTLDRAGASDFKYSMMMMQSDNDESLDAEKLQHLKKSNESKVEEKDGDDDSEVDDFYGKTKEIISFAEKGHHINSHHILSFSTAIDNQTQLNTKLKIRMATLWVMVSSTKTPSEIHDTHTAARRQHHHYNVRNGRTHVNTRTSDVDHNQSLSKRRRRRKKDGSDRYSYYDNHNFDNHIINDKYDDDHIIKSDSYEEWHKARKFSNYTSTNQQNVTLWIFDVRSKNLTINEAKDEGTNNDINHETFNDRMEYSTSKQLSVSQLGWQKIDVTALVQKWYNSNYQNRLEVLVDCSGCIANNIRIHIPIEEKKLKEHTPFLVLHIEPDLIKRTKRRAIDCSQAGKSQCCKQRFYVSFKTLGWDDWIIAPPGYYANYCRGDCGSGIRRTPDTLLTFYSHVFDEVRKYNKLNGNQLCCAPLKFSSMSLIYFGPDGSEIIKRDLPKMVVEECGCP